MSIPLDIRNRNRAMTVMTSESSLDQPQRWRAVAAASVGNALEWFDFVVFGFFAGTMAKVFFPAGDETVALLWTFATFGLTFFIRPFGAIVLGNYADRYGRKAALTLSIVLMVAGSAVIAFAPTYAAVGILAPIIILIARMAQGFSVGGEFGSATAFLAEQDPQRRGFYASWQFASQGLTTILATGFGVVLTGLLSVDQLNMWGWRIPFFFGLLIGPIAYYVRVHLDETFEFRSITASRKPLQDALAGNKSRMLISFGAVVLCTVATYTVLFMPTYATRQLGLAATGSFFAAFLTGAIQFGLAPMFGSLSDRYGRLPFTVTAAVIMLVTIYPLFFWLASVPTLATLLVVQAFIGVLMAAYLGPLPALMAELFPTKMRTTGLSISYAFGVTIFGGFAPFINAWLIQMTGSKLAPSFYLMLAAAISLVALNAARRIGFK